MADANGEFPGQRAGHRGLLPEGGKSTFYRWKERLKDGIPEAIIAEKEARDRAESAEGAAFVPISLKATPVEIQLPNGGVVRTQGQSKAESVVRCAL